MCADVIIGFGEVGETISSITNIENVIDIKNDKSLQKKYDSVELMNICFPFDDSFSKSVIQYVILHRPKLIIIHSTVPPGTTDLLSEYIQQPIIYSPVRGMHKDFKNDILTYTKFWSITYHTKEIKQYVDKFITPYPLIKEWKSVIDLEFAKIATDTTYYGWLISYRNAIDVIAESYGVDKEKIWEFAEQINEKLGNRPIMYSDPKGIGGHCVIPNLELCNDNELFNSISSVIKKMNDLTIQLNSPPNDEKE